MLKHVLYFKENIDLVVNKPIELIPIGYSNRSRLVQENNEDSTQPRQQQQQFGNQNHYHFHHHHHHHN